MEMADNPKLVMAESTGPEKTSLSDTPNRFQYSTAKKSDSFVVDMETFNEGANKDINANSRITLQRNHSKKGVQRGEKKTNSSINYANDTIIASSPREVQLKSTHRLCGHSFWEGQACPKSQRWWPQGPQIIQTTLKFIIRSPSLPATSSPPPLIAADALLGEIVSSALLLYGSLIPKGFFSFLPPCRAWGQCC